MEKVGHYLVHGDRVWKRRKKKESEGKGKNGWHGKMNGKKDGQE